jgi:signal peptidase II
MNEETHRRYSRSGLLKHALLLFVLVAGCNTDLVTKHVATDKLAAGDRIELVSGYLDLRYTENESSAFSMFSSIDPAVRLPLLIAGPLLTSLVVIVLLVLRRRRALLELLPFTLILAGGLGNLIDRVRLGHVVDFIHFHVKGAFSWPIFNVADVLIAIGIGLLLLRMLIDWRRAAPRPA